MKPVRSAIILLGLGAQALAAAQIGVSSSPSASPPASLSIPAPAPYTAETTYAKLVKKYPFIRIASRDVPASVRAVENITYVQRGGHALQLDLYLPARAPAAPLPAIVFVHGGGWQSGVRANFAPMAIRMAERGFAAATVSYRLSPEARYPAAIHDVKAALRWVRAHAGEYGIDPGRIAVGGGSAGGQIASLVGVTNEIDSFDPDGGTGAVSGRVEGEVSSAAQAIVNIDGLSDFTSPAARENEDNPAKQPTAAGAWFGGSYAQKTALWHEASPTFYVGPKTPPILFIGSAQARFSVGREDMVAKLKAQGVATETVLLPDTPHSFWLMDPWLAPTVEATVAFLRAHMGSNAGPR
jgi:acetyl esterase/lipase